MRPWWILVLLVGCISDPTDTVTPVDGPPVVLLAMTNDTDANVTFEVRASVGNHTYPASNVTVPAHQSTTQLYQFGWNVITVGVAVANQTPPPGGINDTAGMPWEPLVMTGYPRVFGAYDARDCERFDNMRMVVTGRRDGEGIVLSHTVETCIDLRT